MKKYRIENYAFSRCGELTNINIPCGVKSLGVCSFWVYESLRSLVIPNSVTNINKCCFACSSLKNIALPNNLTNICDSAFLACKNLEKITILDSVTSLGNEVFIGCDSLQSVVVSKSISVLPVNLFCGCFDLCDLTLSNNIKKSIQMHLTVARCLIQKLITLIVKL